jgi:hypothetical protein
MTRLALLILGYPCAGLPWPASVPANRTDCTGLLSISSHSLHRVGIPWENTLNNGPSVRSALLHAWQGFPANGATCGSVRSTVLLPAFTSFNHLAFHQVANFFCYERRALCL